MPSLGLPVHGGLRSKVTRKPIPIVSFPTGGEVFGLALREAGVVENDLGVGALLVQHKAGNGVFAGCIPNATLAQCARREPTRCGGR